MMTWNTSTETVEIGTLPQGHRFEVAGQGQRRGTVLRLTELTAIVVYDPSPAAAAGVVRGEPIGLALTTKVIPLCL